MASSLTTLVGATPDFQNPGFPSSLLCFSGPCPLYSWSLPFKIFCCLFSNLSLIRLPQSWFPSVNLSVTFYLVCSLCLPTQFTLFHLGPCTTLFLRSHLLTLLTVSDLDSHWLTKFQWVLIACYMKSEIWFKKQKTKILANNCVAFVEGTCMRGSVTSSVLLETFTAAKYSVWLA